MSRMDSICTSAARRDAVTETEFGGRVVFVTQYDDLFKIHIRCDQDHQATFTAFSSRNPTATIAAYGAICKTLFLLDRQDELK